MQNERNTDNTECIYELLGEVYEFEAKVLSCKPSESGYEIILDKTAFFPGGGGQLADEGYINDIKLTDIKKVSGDIIHYLPNEIMADSIVKCRVDKDIRFARMQAHVAEHLVCGIIHKKYGYENVGFHLDKDMIVTMDVDGPISYEDILTIEREANLAIQENVKVYPELPTKDELKARDFRSKLSLSEGLRLVIIEGYDVCACCAPCLSSTGQIGLVKVIDATAHRGGMRLTLIAGMKAVMDYVQLDGTNSTIMKLLSSKRLESDMAVENLLNRGNEQREEINALKRRITAFYEEELSVLLETQKDQVVIFETKELDEVQIRSLLNSSVEKWDGIIGIINETAKGRNFIFATSDELKYPLRSYIKKFNEINASRGGGSDKMVQGNIPHDRELIKVDY